MSDFGQYERDISLLNPFRYRVCYYDNETGLYYLKSRYYDPEVGRFINCDDVNYIGLTESELSYNPFAYCENEPIICEDSNGNAFSINVNHVLSWNVNKQHAGRNIYLYQMYREMHLRIMWRA